MLRATEILNDTDGYGGDLLSRCWSSSTRQIQYFNESHQNEPYRWHFEFFDGSNIVINGEIITVELDKGMMELHCVECGANCGNISSEFYNDICRKALCNRCRVEA